MDIKTNLFNLRDIVYLGIGFFEAIIVLIRIRPEIIFVKGGYVAVPLGLAAVLLRIPFVTHDSDTVPGLANKIISRWARLHATGMPVEFYGYPKNKTRFTGTPVGDVFAHVDENAKKTAKMELGISKDAAVVLVTGGSQGSRRINEVVMKIVPPLLEQIPNCFVIHHVGQGNQHLYGNYKNNRLKVEPFIQKFHIAAAAADIVLSRGSATTIAEMSVQGKPLIIIPSPFLAGGHQIKNAEQLQKSGAAIVLGEAEVRNSPAILLSVIKGLLANKDKREQLSRNIEMLGRPGAAKEIAELLIDLAKEK